MSNEYIFEGSEQQREGLRLHLIEEALDPATIARLEQTGIGSGWRCLEVGAGAGSIMTWLANAVGKRGSVVAIDRTTSHLQSMSVPHVQILAGDLLDVPLEGDFDLVHCRYVLIHNRSGDQMLQRLAHVLRPGGFLVVEEPDFTCASLLNGNADLSQQRVNNAICRMFEGLQLDPAYGLKLPAKTAAAGLQVIESDAVMHLASGSSALARMMGASTSALADRYVATGEASQTDIDEYVRKAGDSQFWTIYYSTISVTATKPDPQEN